MEKEVRELDEGGIDSFHIDIMDGRFVPNFAMSLSILLSFSVLADGSIRYLSEPLGYQLGTKNGQSWKLLTGWYATHKIIGRTGSLCPCRHTPKKRKWQPQAFLLQRKPRKYPVGLQQMRE